MREVDSLQAKTEGENERWILRKGLSLSRRRRQLPRQREPYRHGVKEAPGRRRLLLYKGNMASPGGEAVTEGD